MHDAKVTAGKITNQLDQVNVSFDWMQNIYTRNKFDRMLNRTFKGR